MIRSRIAALMAATLAAALFAAPATATAATVGNCHASQLSLRLTAPKAAAGWADYQIVLTSVSAKPCYLDGYPGVSFAASPAGPEIGPPAARTGAPGRLVVLHRGGRALAVLGTPETGNIPPAKCHPRNAGALRVFAPGDFDFLALRHRFTVCSRPSVPGGRATITAVRAP